MTIFELNKLIYLAAYMAKNIKNKAEQLPQHYFEYIDYVKKNATNLPLKPATYYLKKAKLLHSIISNLPCVVYLVDYRNGHYYYLSKNVEQLLGYTNKEIIEQGQQWMLKNNIHPDDRQIFTSNVFASFLAHTRSFPKSELPNIRFSVNLRAKRKDGVYIHALQQYAVIETDETGNPLLTLGTWNDITAHKTDTKVVFAISHYSKKTGFSVITTDSFPNKQVSISSREADIIKHLIKGHSSKQIAAKLHLSLHTINAHRRNVLKKTNSKSTVELISYAMLNGLN